LNLSGGQRYARARPPDRAAAVPCGSSARQSGSRAAIPRTAPGSASIPPVPREQRSALLKSALQTFGASLLGGLRHWNCVEILGQPRLGDGAMLDDIRQRAGDELAHRD